MYKGHVNEESENKCIKGDGQIFNPSNDKNLTFVFTFDYDDFVDNGKILIDHVEIPRECYTISKGSTIITFDSEFVNSLPEGNHLITAKIDDEEVEAEFSISKIEDSNNTNKTENNKDEKSNNPKTGDSIVRYFVLMFISLTGLIFLVKLKNSL